MTFDVEFEEVTNTFCVAFDTIVHTVDAVLGQKTINTNGTYNASSDGLDGFSRVRVNVPDVVNITMSDCTFTDAGNGNIVITEE